MRVQIGEKHGRKIQSMGGTYAHPQNIIDVM